jgi:hypothetical protein
MQKLLTRNHMQTVVKTRTATTTRVFIATVAVLMLGLAAYGLGYGFMPKFSPVPSAVRQTTPSPSVGGSQVATSPKSDATKVATPPKNKPKITVEGIESDGYGKTVVGNMHSTKNVKLYDFKIEPTFEPQQFGVIQVKQLVFNVRIPAGVSMHSFYLMDEKKAISGYSVVGVRKSSPTKIYKLAGGDIGQGEGDNRIISFPKEGEGVDEFDIIINIYTFYQFSPEGFKAALWGTVDGTKVESSVAVNAMVSMYGSNNEPQYRGYVIDNRKYAQNSENPLAVTPASNSIFYLLRADSPVDTEPNNVRPKYLKWCPTIWSDSSSQSHSAMPGSNGGSNDWFCLNGLIGKMILSEF